MSETYEQIEARILEAVPVHENQPDRPISTLADEFDVPYPRLYARLNGRQSRIDRPATNKKLTSDMEEGLCQYLHHLDRIGTAARLPMVTGAANSILRRNHVGGGDPLTVGEKWTKRFLGAHPEFYIRKQKTLDINRKNSHDPDLIEGWFRRLKEQIEEKGILLDDMYNMDETGFRIGVGKNQWIVTIDPSWQSYLASSNNRDYITVVEVIQGLGKVLPPMVILAATQFLGRWFNNDIEDNTLFAVSETGYSNDELSLDWVKHFDKYSSRCQKGGWWLLLLDGYGSHCTYEFLNYCEDRNIVVFCLPAHTTHFLQPLDVVIF